MPTLPSSGIIILSTEFVLNQLEPSYQFEGEVGTPAVNHMPPFHAVSLPVILIAPPLVPPSAPAPTNLSTLLSAPSEVSTDIVGVPPRVKILPGPVVPMPTLPRSF